MADTLADQVDAESLADLRTVISELVSISVSHGATSPIDLRVELIGDEIEGVVDDHGPGTRAIRRARDHSDDTLVLRIIDGMADEWDITQNGVRFRMPMHHAH